MRSIRREKNRRRFNASFRLRRRWSEDVCAVRSATWRWKYARRGGSARRLARRALDGLLPVSCPVEIHERLVRSGWTCPRRLTAKQQCSRAHDQHRSKRRRRQERRDECRRHVDRARSAQAGKRLHARWMLTTSGWFPAQLRSTRSSLGLSRSYREIGASLSRRTGCVSNSTS